VAGCPVQQLDAQTPFQRIDAPTQHDRRYMLRKCGFCEASLIHRIDESLDLF